MVINRKSLHYRFNVFASFGSDKFGRDVEKHRSLCSYFWFTMWNIFKCVFIVSIVGFLLVLPALGMTDKPLEVQFVASILAMPFYFMVPLLMLTGLVMWVIGALVVVGLLTGIGNVWQRLKDKKYRRDMKKHFDENGNRITPVKKESGLLMSFIKAKKSKVCPLVTFKGERK